MSDILRDLAQEGNNHSEGVNDALEKMAEDLDKNYDVTNDKGTDALMSDLVYILDDAFHYEFHDFKNKKYPNPKMILRQRLLDMAQSVIDGKYDN